jgi:hypothetical protein
MRVALNELERELPPIVAFVALDEVLNAGGHIA